MRELGLRNKVTFHGFLPNEQLIGLMRRNHIFIHLSQSAQPHRYDTCPVVVSEAMAQGMAIVATRHGGIPEEVVDDESGMLVEERDATVAAERIVALARDSGLRARLGEGAWRRATEMFSEAVVYSHWHELLGLKSHAGPNAN